MKLAIDAFDVRPQGKGVARVVTSLIPELALRWPGPVSVLTTGAGQGLISQTSAVEVHVVPAMHGNRWERVGLASACEDIGADVVYAHREIAFVRDRSLLLHVPEDPRLRWGKSLSPRELARAIHERVHFQGSVRRAAVVAASTGTMRNQIADRVGVARKSLHVVPLGFDPALFQPLASPSDDFLFHLGSADPRDRTSTVVDAYSRVVAKDGYASPPLIVAGDLGARRIAIERRAYRLGLGAHVRLVGRVTDSELRRLYGSTALCVQPSDAEGFGLQPLEALACGAPLLVADAPSVTEVVGDAAMVVDHPDVSRLADAMDALLRDSGQRRRLRLAGPQRASHMKWSDTAERLVPLLEVAAASVTKTAR